MQYINLPPLEKMRTIKDILELPGNLKSGYTIINFLSYDKSFVVMLESLKDAWLRI